MRPRRPIPDGWWICPGALFGLVLWGYLITQVSRGTDPALGRDAPTAATIQTEMNL